MKAAFIVFERMTFLDFIGFYDAITRLKTMNIHGDFEWRTCAMTPQVADDRGLKIVVDAVGESLTQYDLLFVPGGFGTRALQHDANFVNWLQTASNASLKVSVCTGALLLGSAGYLKGLRATTHPSAYKELEPYCKTVVQERIVDEGSVIAGADARARVATQMDYPYRWKA
jgi:cyclohexyl-isocyanide hydratase